MTKNESEKALMAYDKLDNLMWFHNKNLTRHQYETLDAIRDVLRELSNKAYYSKKGEQK